MVSPQVKKDNKACDAGNNGQLSSDFQGCRHDRCVSMGRPLPDNQRGKSHVEGSLYDSGQAESRRE